MRAAHPAMGAAQRACGWRPTAPGSGRCALGVRASLLRFPACPWQPSSAEGQACCPFSQSVVWLRAELPPTPPAYPHPPPWAPTPFQAGRLACSRTPHTDRCPVAPFLPPRPSALLSRACCPKQMPSPWLRRKETWPQTLFWRPGRTSAHYRVAVTRRCPPGLRLGVLHSVTWLSASRPRGCAGFWGPVSVRVHVCLRDVHDCG